MNGRGKMRTKAETDRTNTLRDAFTKESLKKKFGNFGKKKERKKA